MDDQQFITMVKTVLAKTPQRWIDLAGTFPVEALDRRPLPEEWSATECLAHIIDTEKVFEFRLPALLEGRDFPAFNPDLDGNQGAPADPITLAEKFAKMRAVNLAILERVTVTDLVRKAVHAELGPVSLAQMLNEWVAHDLNHTIQAERALTQPFIHDCGPWQIYFQDVLMK